MSTQDDRAMISEKLRNAKIAVSNARQSLHVARFLIQDAYTTAHDSQDETLNVAIISDYLNIVTQLLAHMDMWQQSLAIVKRCERCDKETVLTRVSLPDGTQATMLCDECVPIVVSHSRYQVTSITEKE